MDLIRALLAAQPAVVDSLAAWWAATANERAAFATPVERAVIGGALADRVGYAFAGGYGEALRALLPGLEGITALCITEAGGNHPKAIETKLVAVAGGYEVSGHKKWATVGSLAQSLLVCVTVGEHRLRMVRVRADAPGLTITASNVPFVPEIPHAEITLDRVRIAEADVLPGDGYDDYVKPFRTIEDIHVHAALLGYLVGVARRKQLPRDVSERLLALVETARSLARADAKAATTHVALAGAFALIARELTALEQLWAAAPDDEWQRWQRDRALLQVAGKAREARRDKAWSLLP
ncbi:MAG TPA: acyl-CoA dehydrogenase family protein [Kofleriaceae bacterium]